MLHEIDEVRVYCGPAALMAVTGKRLPDVRSAINQSRGARGNRGVCGITASIMDESLTRLGIQYEKTIYPKGYRPTLKNLKHTMAIGMTYIVNITGHFVTCEDGKLVDNHYRFGTDLDDCKWTGKCVKIVWRIKQ